MHWLDTIWTATGWACALPLIVVLWTMAWRSWLHARTSRNLFAEWQRGFRQALDQREQGAREAGGTAPEAGGWKGFRRLRVDGIERETDTAVSIWLAPEDGKPLAPFRPGQYLTLRLRAGGPRPLTRCYSLSAPLANNRYRITVKAIPAAPGDERRPSVSRWLNQELMPSDLIESRAPQGDFVLDGPAEVPLVLAAAGIGITPLVCMLHAMAEQHSTRPVVLVYGNRNGRDHVFREEITRLAARLPALRVVHCYSRPLPSDVQGRDYHVQGHVTAGLISQILPHRRFQFLLCGPPTFMHSLHSGLVEWGVPDERILREAFGPASVGSPASGQAPSEPKAKSAAPVPVRFAASELDAEMTGQEQSILELAESMSVEISSGCRAGSCGSCAVRLLKGKVRYRDRPSAEVDPGYCLACIAEPDGPVEVEA